MKKEEQAMKEEILAKLREAKSAEDFIAITKESGRELTAEQARELYDRLHGSGELSDDDLAKVAGGGKVVETVIKILPTAISIPSAFLPE